MEVPESQTQGMRLGLRSKMSNLRSAKVICPLMSAGYCATQLLVLHEFSLYKLSSALIFSTVGPIGIERLSGWLKRSV